MKSIALDPQNSAEDRCWQDKKKKPIERNDCWVPEEVK